jgi:hypothetical protein
LDLFYHADDTTGEYALGTRRHGIMVCIGVRRFTRVLSFCAPPQEVRRFLEKAENLARAQQRVKTSPRTQASSTAGRKQLFTLSKRKGWEDDMQKRVIEREPASRVSEADWLDLESQATVEITSEESNRPIELAFRGGEEVGWRAGAPGVQVIRLLFHQPRRISRIRLRFTEKSAERTQEFVLRWAPDQSQPFQEIVRQHWNFSPQGSNIELEDHHVNLNAVRALELTVNPDVAGRRAFASLDELRIG